MSLSSLDPVLFVDLSWEHQALKTDLLSAVSSVLDRNDFVLGKAVAEFEANFAIACGARHGVGVGCGTDALSLGLIACGIGAGDEVILPANTFVATLIGVLHSGATPVFVDCDLETALMDLKAAEAAITPYTRAILPVHLYGQMVSPKQLLELAAAHDLLIFEDAAQAHLASREGYQAGSVGMGAAFSFYPSKNLGGLGDGGMVTTASDLVAQTVRSLRNYGATRKYYHTESAGINSRLDTLQAAVLNLKLDYLPDWNRQRYELANYYDEQLKPLVDYGVAPIRNDSGEGHVYHLYVVRLTEACPLSRHQIQRGLAQVGIQTGIHYPTPCHLQPAFQFLGYQPGQFPYAEALSETIISLPMHPGLQPAQIDRVVAALRQQLNEMLPVTEPCY